MIENLKQIEDKMMLNLLIQQDKWNTLFINYHPPIVERCWIQVGNYRLFLHFIHKCETKDALYHPHTWPSAIHILSGKYEMGLATKYLPGFSEMNEILNGNCVDKAVKYLGPDLNDSHSFVKEICRVELEGNNYYEMLSPDGWHYVRPIGEVCASVMLTGKPWGTEEIKDPGKLGPLPPGKKAIMLQWFEEYYRNRIHIQKIVENEKIKKGDWVKLDSDAMSISDKRGMEKYIDMLGFVIGRDKNFIDVRFGNDRTKVHARNLILMGADTKPQNIKAEAKKKDDMDPDNWDDEASDKKINKKNMGDMNPDLWPDDKDDV